MTLLQIVIVNGLATYAIATMIQDTDGPFDVFLRLRKLVGIVYVPVYNYEDVQVDIIEEIGDRPLAKLLACFWCTATWIALIGATVLYSYIEYWPVIFIVWFASVGVAGVLYK